MPTKKQPGNPIETPLPGKHPGEIPPFDPEEPLLVPIEDPDIIPDEDPFETPAPFEIPPPGEGQ